MDKIRTSDLCRALDQYLERMYEWRDVQNCLAPGKRDFREKFFYWQRILHRDAFESSQASSLSATVGLH